jgi:hypothetical protein
MDKSCIPIVVAIINNCDLGNDSLTLILEKNSDWQDVYTAAEKNIKFNALNNDMLMKLGYDINQPQIWIKIIDTGQFSNAGMMEIGRISNNQFVWEKIATCLISNGCTKDELIQFGKEASNIFFWSIIIPNLKYYTNNELIEIGTTSNESWEQTAKCLKLANHTNSDLITLGEKANNDFVWDKINDFLQLSGLDNIKLLEIGKDVSLEKLWKKIARLLNLHGYDNKQLMALGGEINNEHIWLIIMKTNKFNSNVELIKIGKTADSHNVWKEISTRLHLHSLVNKDLIELGDETKSYFVWKEVKNHLKLHEYTEVELIELGFKFDTTEFWEKVNIALSSV